MEYNLYQKRVKNTDIRYSKIVCDIDEEIVL